MMGWGYQNDQPASASKVDREFQRIADHHKRQGLAFEALSHQVTRIDTNLQLQAQREAIRESLKESQGYASFVMGAGYAGAFVLWQLVKADMHPIAHVLVGLLLGASLATYVAWEVYRMAQTSFAQGRAYETLLDDPTGEDGPTATETLHTIERRLHTLWPMALACSIYPAVLAAGILMGSLAYKLVQSV